jgi:phosphoglycerate dehydrogenase-like enzyme
MATLQGKTACIVGLGAIGTRCAQLARAFRMRVIAIRRRPETAAGDPVPADEVGGPADLVGALERSRVVMVVVPGTPATRGMIGLREMAVLRGAYLLNAGRGPCVDTDALVEALRDGRVRGAGLDVTDPEPLPSGHPLWTTPNVIITPHYAGSHPGYDREAFAVFLENLGLYLRGEPLRGVVDKAQGY